MGVQFEGLLPDWVQVVADHFRLRGFFAQSQPHERITQACEGVTQNAGRRIL